MLDGLFLFWPLSFHGTTLENDSLVFFLPGWLLHISLLLIQQALRDRHGDGGGTTCIEDD